MNGFGYGFGFRNFEYVIFPMIFFLIVITIFTIIILSIVNNTKRGIKNNNSPVLKVDAKVVSKRTDISHHHHNGMDNTMSHQSSSTWYYVTFEVESGDRMEFEVSGNEYGMLVESDMGKLTFQGTRYQGFQR